MYRTGEVYLSARDICRVLGGRVTPSTLRTWKDRGHLTHHGRNRYDLGEVLTRLDATETA